MSSGERDRHRLVLLVDRLDPTGEHDVGADTVIGNRHDGGEPHVVLADRARVTHPLGDIAAAEAHGQHAVGDRGVQSDLFGDLVVPVDRVEVAGHPGVVDQVGPGQGDGPLRQLVADLHRTELTQCHRQSHSLHSRHFARRASCSSPGQRHRADW